MSNLTQKKLPFKKKPSLFAPDALAIESAADVSIQSMSQRFSVPTTPMRIVKMDPFNSRNSIKPNKPIMAIKEETKALFVTRTNSDFQDPSVQIVNKKRLLYWKDDIKKAQSKRICNTNWTDEQKKVLDTMNNNRNIFFTGAAGTF